MICEVLCGVDTKLGLLHVTVCLPATFSRLKVHSLQSLSLPENLFSETNKCREMVRLSALTIPKQGHVACPKSLVRKSKGERDFAVPSSLNVKQRVCVNWQLLNGLTAEFSVF